MAVAVGEAFGRPGFDPAITHDQGRFNQNVAYLAAISAGVHAHRAAHRAGNAAQKLQAGNACVARFACHGDSHRRCARAYAIAWFDRDRGEALGKPHDDAWNAAIAHDQVRPHADCHHGYSRVERAQKVGEIIHIARTDKPFGRAAGAKPDELGQRTIRLDQAGERRQIGSQRGKAHLAALAVLMPSARPAAHLVMSPAPRQITMSPLAARSRNCRDRSSRPSTSLTE